MLDGAIDPFLQPNPGANKTYIQAMKVPECLDSLC